MSNTRLYRIDGPGARRLVRAHTKAQAMAHVARSTLEIRVATQDDIVELVAANIKPEAATLLLDPRE